MPQTRRILEELKQGELLAALDRFQLDVYDRRACSQAIDALAKVDQLGLAELLADLPRDRLKELCRTFGLDDSGRAKAEIVDRILGRDAAPANASSRKVPPEGRELAKLRLLKQGLMEDLLTGRVRVTDMETAP